ncbi:6899_t:CDS:2, partial [Scutellospora calospora]
ICFWSITKFLTRTVKCFNEPPYDLIILNQPISLRKNIFHTLWENANMKICADGGGNQLYDAFEGTDKYIPHYIRGDLDSLRDNVRDFYISKVERDQDQNSTDFMKCIELVRRKEGDSSIK